MMNISTLDAAQGYAARGWPVLPLRPGTKFPATRHGKDDASLDAVQIAEWFPAGFDFGVGIVTGAASGLLVVDIDPRNGGDAGFDALKARHGALPATLVARTGGGGRHLLFALPADVTGLHDRPNAGGFKGVDLKAGGYIVAAPSGHPSGGVYEWANDQPLAPAPDWLITLAQSSSKSAAAVRSGGVAIVAGSRNDTLFRIASRYRGMGMPEDALRFAVAAENIAHCQPPLSDSEVDQVVQSALRYKPNAGPLSDLALARLLVERLDGDARYVHTASRWMVWTGQRWEADLTGVVARAAKAVADTLALEADLIEDSEARKKARSVAKAAGSARSLGNMLSLAQTEPGISIPADAFDCDPFLLNVANGMVCLRTGEILPHDRTAFQSKLIPINYDPAANAPRWCQFLDEFTANDPELVDYLHRLVGLAATGDNTVQLFHILLGAGANGKSLFQKTISSALGDYAHTAPAALLLDKGASAPTNDLAALQGKRLVTLSEAPAGARVDTTRLKGLTGGEPVTARKLFAEFETFQPVAKFLWGLNGLPSWDADDAALWRRTRVIPCARIFRPEEQDLNLAATLRGEAAGVLSWIVKGAVTCLRDGLGTCPAIEVATAAARAEVDELGAFLGEECDQFATALVDAGTLFFRYQWWATNNGAAPATPTSFGRALTRRGFAAGKAGGRRVRTGIALRKQGAAA